MVSELDRAKIGLRMSVRVGLGSQKHIVVQWYSPVLEQSSSQRFYLRLPSPEKVDWTRSRIDCQKVYLTLFISFLLKNENQPEESGVDMSTPVHPVVPPLAACNHANLLNSLLKTQKNSACWM